MEDLYVEVNHAASPRKAGAPCGDVLACERTAAGTTIVLADGIGHGVRAHVAATMATARFTTLMALDFSLREAFARLVHTMEAQRSPDLPYAALTAVRILAGGETTVLSYETPASVLVGAAHAAVLPRRMLDVEGWKVSESQCVLEPGEGILFFSDGISQAGLGRGLPEGWGEDGVARFVNDSLQEGAEADELPERVHARARALWGARQGDDCTAVLATCRPGRSVTILTGPPARKEKDATVVERFLACRGRKAVCGATTARIVAGALGRPVEVDQHETSFVAPPRYRLEGIDLVTEGAVTLNQVYNVLDAPPEDLHERSAVSDLCTWLRMADRVRLIVGTAVNGASSDIAFRQQGILPRGSIVPLLAERLRDAGKLVVIEFV